MPEIYSKIIPVKKRIALVGFRYTGKSTIAKGLSRRWNLPVISTDDEIEKKYGESISSLVSKNGWDFFRNSELDLLIKVQSEKKRIILDTGGGIVEGKNFKKGQEKIDILKNNFFTIFLFITEDTLMNRIHHIDTEKEHQKQRPRLSQKDSYSELIQIYRKRRAWYKEAAHVVVDISDAGVYDSIRRIELLLNKNKVISEKISELAKKK